MNFAPFVHESSDSEAWGEDCKRNEYLVSIKQDASKILGQTSGMSSPHMQ
jgi:hypothetical protein